MDIEELPVNIPAEKFTEYALIQLQQFHRSFTKGIKRRCMFDNIFHVDLKWNCCGQPDKAMAFREALGYTMANYRELIDNINRHFDIKQMVFKGNNGFGDVYECVMRLKGANSKEANVCTGWINDFDKNELRLTSAYVTDKKVTKNDKS